MKLIVTISKHRFPLGRFIATAGAMEIFTAEEMAEALQRHSQGDWGEVCPEDARENELSLELGNRLLSAYTFRENRMWLITEADRSQTTILLPEEY